MTTLLAALGTGPALAQTPDTPPDTAPVTEPAPPAPAAAVVTDSADPGDSGRARVDVDARLAQRTGRVEGEVRAVFRNPGAQPLERGYFWLLPNRLSRPPAALDDVNHYWIYPSGFNPGAMTLIRVRAGPLGREVDVPESAWRMEPHAVAGAGALVSIALPEPVARGQEVAVVLEYRARIPERYGPLGCIDGQCTLMGGFYPMLAALDATGWRLDAAPERADMQVSVALAEPASAVLFGQIFGQEFGQTPGPGKVSEVRAQARAVPYAPLVVAPRLYESRRQHGPLAVRYLGRQPPPPTDVAHEQILPYTKENHARYALDSTSAGLALLTAIKAPMVGDQVVMVEAPLRFELASSHPGVITVSDRFYRIWPAKRFRKFHERQLMRALFAHLMARLVEERAREADRDVELAADMVATYLTDLYVVQQYKKSESMGDILQPVAFIPVVDQLLYAPQTMFAGAYFGSVLDDERVRDDPRRFMHQEPRGKLVYEKLRDMLTPEAMRATMRAIIVDGVPLRAAAENAYGAPLGWFFRQWLGPYPVVDYRLLGTSSRRVPETETDTAGGHRDSDSDRDSDRPGMVYEHEIRVERRTPASSQPGQPLLEPVTVLVVLKGGERRVLRWDGRGSIGVLRFTSRAAIDRVVIDPMGRLVERNLPGEHEHPLFNNRDKHRLRFVYNSFGVLLNISDLSALLAADFTLRRVHDVHHGSRFSIYTSESTRLGVTGRYMYSFGPGITPDRLLSSVTTRLSVQRLRSQFFGEGERAASRLSVSLNAGSTDRLFFFEPRFARDFGFGGSLALTRFDAGDTNTAELGLTGSLGVSYSHVSTLGRGHTLAVELDGSAVFGDIDARSQLTSAGGAAGLRGYAPGALFARSRALARVEYRHVFSHRLNWNLGHYNFLRGVGGALFADAGALSSCERHDLAGKDNLYASVGYGVRFFYDSFGTLPQFMRLDVAVPLVTRDRSCFGSPLGQGPPLMVYLGFVPPF